MGLPGSPTQGNVLLGAECVFPGGIRQVDRMLELEPSEMLELEPFLILQVEELRPTEVQDCVCGGEGCDVRDVENLAT